MIAAKEKTKGTSPPVIVSMPNMIASIAIIVTESGRCLNDSLSVLNQVFVSIQQYNLVW
jgi:hypothetical protein